MRCVDCLAVIEDYFDGELGAERAALVAAHLPACAGCAAALEALESEQAVYMSYDRGLEVTPALWEGVRAGIARAAEAETFAVPARGSAPRLRGLLEAAFASLALRPALASSLALLVFGVVAGSLLFKPSDTRETRPAAPGQVAQEAPSRPAGVDVPDRVENSVAAGQVTPDAAPAGSADGSASSAGDGVNSGLVAASAANVGRAGAGSPPPGPTNIGGPPSVSAPGPAPAEDRPPDPDHLEVAGGDLLPLVRTASLESVDPEEAAAAAGLLTSEAKDVARHVERAQMLLRSFRNARSAEVSEAEVAYEKELSRRLLEENVTLRAGAEAAGDEAAGRVLEAIQPFLLDIANMREKPSRQEVRSIKERMRKTEIVAALQVY